MTKELIQQKAYEYAAPFKTGIFFERIRTEAYAAGYTESLNDMADLKAEVESLKAQLAAVERDFNDYSKSVNGLL
jgi:hypothetical protein